MHHIVIDSDINEVVKTTNNSGVNDIDQISNIIFEKCAYDLSYPVRLIINLSLEYGLNTLQMSCIFTKIFLKIIGE